ncbi:MAG: TMEM165/GDT1 family protein [Planctomycetota bacterium]|jgi:putative Ca2+/H+ antiporter (TMEM165/GDT1 family)
MAASVFFMVFIAELGDKTQLATLNFATQSESKLPVLLGAAGALFATTLLTVLFC